MLGKKSYLLVASAHEKSLTQQVLLLNFLFITAGADQQMDLLMNKMFI